MSDQSDIGAKLDRVVNELHETNKLLVEVIADNKHRDIRLDDVEKLSDKHSEELTQIKEWHIKNDEAIEDLKDFMNEYRPTVQKQKDRDDLNKKAYAHVYVKAVLLIALGAMAALGLNNIPAILKAPTTQEQKQNH